MGGGGGYTLCEGGYTINLSYWWVVEEVTLPVEEFIHPVEEVIVILVSAQVPLVLTLGLWTLGLRTWA